MRSNTNISLRASSILERSNILNVDLTGAIDPIRRKVKRNLLMVELYSLALGLSTQVISSREGLMTCSYSTI